MSKLGVTLRVALLLLLVFFYFSSIDLLPFHPDESSYLFQSASFERFLKPSSLYYTPGRPLDLIQNYRMKDGPLFPLSLGALRYLARFQASQLPTDWQWSWGWEENLLNQAYPQNELLQLGRGLSTAFALAAVLLLYMGVKAAFSEPAALCAATLFAFNSLVLLHARRSMAEGALLFGVALCIWALSRPQRNAPLLAVAFALAALSKYNLVLLFPIGMLAAWQSTSSKAKRQKIMAVFSFASIYFMMLALFHPSLWAAPLAGLQKMWQLRTTLISSTVSLLESEQSVIVLHGFREKLQALLAQSFFLPPAYAEVQQHFERIAGSIAAYEKEPLLGLLRGWWMGSAMLLLSLFGGVRGLLSTNNPPSIHDPRKNYLILFSLYLALTLLVFLPFAYQRYYLPLLPLVSLWAGIGLSELYKLLREIYKVLISTLNK